jgi:hypothetical protein
VVLQFATPFVEEKVPATPNGIEKVIIRLTSSKYMILNFGLHSESHRGAVVVVKIAVGYPKILSLRRYQLNSQRYFIKWHIVHGVLFNFTDIIYLARL